MHTWRVRDRELTFERCLVMGIVNVTPDSFSDGGRYADPDAAVRHAFELADQGADILDVGGESTRPGSLPVRPAEQIARVLPVVRAVCERGGTIVSVDTSSAEVAEACLAAGAHVINDVTGLRGDERMPHVAKQFGAGVVVMHMQGTPATMQVNPHYDDVVVEVYQFLQERLESLAGMGLAPEYVALDPGIGFGKTHEHNLTLLARLDAFQRLGRPLCLGVSRKGMIDKVTGRPVDQRTAGSLAIACHALARGAAQVLRVHDVAETRDAVLMLAALRAREE